MAGVSGSVAVDAAQWRFIIPHEIKIVSDMKLLRHKVLLIDVGGKRPGSVGSASPAIHLALRRLVFDELLADQAAERRRLCSGINHGTAALGFLGDPSQTAILRVFEPDGSDDVFRKLNIRLNSIFRLNQ